MAEKKKTSKAAASPKENIVVTRNLTKILEATVPVTLVKDINISIPKGEFVAIIGPSGSGKSSLMYLLGLLDHPTSGSIQIGGMETNDMDEAELARFRLEHIGFVFQFHFLLPEFTCMENVMLPMKKLDRLSKPEMEKRAKDLLLQLGLEGHINKTPDKLSGGQRQRVAIARALANEPLLILADEPTGNLDTKSTENVVEILQTLARVQHKTIAVVTHDPRIAKAADRRIVIVDGKVDTSQT